jgi:hypothetical protein
VNGPLRNLGAQPAPGADASRFIGRSTDDIEDLAIVLRGSRRDLSSVYATIESQGKVRILAWQVGTGSAIRGSRS